jgi:hypothetical protein
MIITSANTVPGHSQYTATDLLRQRAERIRDTGLKRETLDAFANPSACIAHRAGLSEHDKL